MNASRAGICPSCAAKGQFELIGTQQLPPQFAEKHGLPTSIRLWHCSKCGTTVSEVSLLESEKPHTGALPSVRMP